MERSKHKKSKPLHIIEVIDGDSSDVSESEFEFTYGKVTLRRAANEL